ncbi:putative NOP5 family protein [Candidatus Burarchaeum australiense]|nr:putative NOP5 family protein [Candidatus Burarchaeum australiense]
MFNKRRDFLADARAGIKEAHASRDMLLSHTVKAIFEVNRAANLLYETLTEWYGLYFPELRVSEPATFAKLVQLINREDLKASDLSPLVGDQKARELEGKARTSMGAALKTADLAELTKLARKLEELYVYRASLEEYQAALANEIAPNLSLLAGPELAANLIARAGSLRKLAFMPASTIQVLGAEKALFKHLKKHTKPPKHGLIFQHVSISMAPIKQRGRIARALSTKLAICSKADAFTRNPIGAKLKEEFDARLKAIQNAPVRPPSFCPKQKGAPFPAGKVPSSSPSAPTTTSRPAGPSGSYGKPGPSGTPGKPGFSGRGERRG